jgi:hypothetical protein
MAILSSSDIRDSLDQGKTGIKRVSSLKLAVFKILYLYKIFKTPGSTF